MDQPATSLGQHDDRPLEYRAVSRLAVASAACGVLSGFVFALPGLLFLPIIGALLAIGALLSIHRMRPQLSGRPVAYFGLALSLLLLAWMPTQAILRRQTLYRQAQPLARDWLQAIADGRLSEAYQYCLPDDRRVPTGTPLDRYYRENETELLELQTYFEALPLRPLMDHGASGNLQFTGYAGQRHTGFELIRLRYEFIYSADGKAGRLPIEVDVARHFDRTTRRADWQIQRARNPGNDL